MVSGISMAIRIYNCYSNGKGELSMLKAMSWEALLQLLQLLVEGTGKTLSLFFLTLLFALPLGMAVALCRMSKYAVIRKPFEWIILVLRGTPLLLQIILVYFGPYYLFGLNLDRFTAAVIAFSLNYAAYFAEIYRGGIQSIPQGQYEAGAVLGFTRVQVFFKIILPQVIKRSLPPISNEVITLIKDTALVNIIGIAELFTVSKEQTRLINSVTPMFVAGIFYLIMNGIITRIFVFLEKRFDYYK